MTTADMTTQTAPATNARVGKGRVRAFKTPSIDALIPLVGPVAFFALWEGVCAAHVVRAVLLPPPIATLTYLVDALFHGTLAADTFVTIERTLEAFAVGSILGVPIGAAFGSSVRLYRSVEFVVDFFRTTPASALIPLSSCSSASTISIKLRSPRSPSSSS